MSAAACPACKGTGTITHDRGQLPCPYCEPDAALAASAIYDPLPEAVAP